MPHIYVFPKVVIILEASKYAVVPDRRNTRSTELLPSHWIKRFMRRTQMIHSGDFAAVGNTSLHLENFRHEIYGGEGLSDGRSRPRNNTHINKDLYVQNTSVTKQLQRNLLGNECVGFCLSPM
jgi:hypothetical protein